MTPAPEVSSRPDGTDVARVVLLRADPGEVDRFSALLTPADRTRAQRFRAEVDRQRSLCAAGLLREATAALTGADPTAAGPAAGRTGRWCRSCASWGDHGRPVALDAAGRPVPGVHLSATHAGRVVLVAACADAPVGVDVDLVEGVRFAGFDASVLSPAERDHLAGVPADARDEARARAWTRKESLLKATGHGLALAPHRLGFTGPILTRWPSDLDADLAGGSRTVDLPGLPVGHVGAVTVLAPELEL